MKNDERAALYRVAYDEAIRALAGQQVVIESLRTRAGLLLSAAAVTTSFLGSNALENGGPVAWMGLLGFAATAGSCLAVLWPRRWELTVEPLGAIRGGLAGATPPTLGELYEQIALAVEQGVVRNESVIAQLSSLLQSAAVMLSVDVTLWLIAAALGA